MSDRLNLLLSKPFINFVKENKNADVSQLLLKGVPDGIDKTEVAQQIQSRRKAKGKLPDWLANENIVFPPPLSIEQSSSQLTTTYKKSLLGGSHVIDLTGGMGVDLIGLSDKFDQATHVEIDPWLSEVFDHNAKTLTKRPISVVNDSAENFLANFQDKATFFIDPARRDSSKKRVFLFEDCSPNVISLLLFLKEKADCVLIKSAPMIDITLGIKQLQHVSEVHVVSLHNECKEVLFVLDFNFVGNPQIHCVNIKANETESLTFDLETEKNTKVKFGDVQQYLYEPNASIRKAGAFKSIAQEYGLIKIAPSTHLYTSEELVVDFPGRTFEVTGVVNKKNVKSFFPGGQANVISKNHPLSAEQIKKKFELKDGGENFLIGFRDWKERVQLAAMDRIN